MQGIVFTAQRAENRGFFSRSAENGAFLEVSKISLTRYFQPLVDIAADGFSTDPL